MLLSLAASALYAILSLAVSRQTREIGIRIALGADRWRIARDVASRAVVQIGIGVVLGLPVVGLLSYELLGLTASGASVSGAVAMALLLGVAGTALATQGDENLPCLEGGHFILHDNTDANIAILVGRGLEEGDTTGGVTHMWYFAPIDQDVFDMILPSNVYGATFGHLNAQTQEQLIPSAPARPVLSRLLRHRGAPTDHWARHGRHRRVTARARASLSRARG